MISDNFVTRGRTWRIMWRKIQIQQSIWILKQSYNKFAGFSSHSTTRIFRKFQSKYFVVYGRSFFDELQSEPDAEHRTLNNIHLHVLINVPVIIVTNLAFGTIYMLKHFLARGTFWYPAQKFCNFSSEILFFTISSTSNSLS